MKINSIFEEKSLVPQASKESMAERTRWLYGSFNSSNGNNSVIKSDKENVYEDLPNR